MNAMTEQDFKRAVKEALTETLEENRDLLQAVVVEALEDFAMLEAIRAGEKTRPASRDEVFQVLQGRR